LIDRLQAKQDINK